MCRQEGLYYNDSVTGKSNFSGRGLNEVVGPIGIIGEIGKAVESGIKDVLNLAVVITLNLGIMNLIPFPALDGGRLTYCWLRVSEEIQLILKRKSTSILPDLLFSCC